MSLKNDIGKSTDAKLVRRQILRSQLRDRFFAVGGLLVMAVACLVLLALLLQLAYDGIGRVSWQFVSSYPSRFASQAGILSALIGTILVMVLTAATAIPLGIGAAIYLEEYAPKNWMTDLIEINITNLAGVPSIVYGLMALGLLVYEFHLGQSFLTAGLTLAMLILPMVIIATREALRAVPPQIREAAFALGATKWRVLGRHVLPGTDAPIIVKATLDVGAAIVLTAGLSFIGLGAVPPQPEWGAIIKQGADKGLEYWWYAAAPGLAIVSVVMGLSFFGDGLRDALDPKRRS